MTREPAQNDDDPEWTRPMRCACCRECREERDRRTGQWTGRCIYGGPFNGYVEVPDV